MIFDKMIDKIVAKKIKEYKDRIIKYLYDNKNVLVDKLKNILKKYLDNFMILIQEKIMNKINNLFNKAEK